MKKFAIIGAAGYIARKHLQAIRDTGHSLVAAMDKFDSVGILDQYFPQTYFFTEIERFDRFLDKEKRQGSPLDYLAVCTPNYLHDAHVRLGLRNGTSVICEKPLVLNPWNLDILAADEREAGRQVFNILQLRMHPVVQEIKQNWKGEHRAQIELTYVTPRGNWYASSWKGDEAKSGGIATNIGIHFFDMLSWIFGKAESQVVHLHTEKTAAGYLQLQQADVRWFLSIDGRHLPEGITQSYRSISIDGKAVEFSDGFTDLHTKSYEAILEGKGFGIEETRASVELVHELRNKPSLGLTGDYHPMAGKI